MSINRISVPSCTSGNALTAELIRVSRVRTFFGMRSVKLNVYSQGMLGAPFKWGGQKTGITHQRLQVTSSDSRPKRPA
jgi:hypothetical protein